MGRWQGCRQRDDATRDGGIYGDKAKDLTGFTRLIGEYFADLLIEGDLVIELKAVRALVKQHEAQLVSYLVATNKDIGLLIDFGPSVQVKRKYRQYKAPVKQS